MITEAILSTVLGKFGDKLTDALKPKDVQAVKIKQDPDSFSSTEIEKAKTIEQKWTNKDNPILKFENVLEKDSIVKQVSLIPDTAFKTKGKIRITIDDVDVFKSRTFDSFEDVVDTVVPINKTISQDSKVKIFMISSDGTAVGITAQVTFGE